MAMKYIKKVKIHVFYIDHSQGLKISPIFITNSMRHSAKDGR